MRRWVSFVIGVFLWWGYCLGSGGLSGGSTIACLGLCDQIYFGVKINPRCTCVFRFPGVYCMGC